MLKWLKGFIIGMLEAVGRAEITAIKESCRLNHFDQELDGDRLDGSMAEPPSTLRQSRRADQMNGYPVDHDIAAAGGHTTAGTHPVPVSHNVLDDDGKPHLVETEYLEVPTSGSGLKKIL